MNKEEIKKNYEEKTRKFLENYIETEKQNNKNINEINPWEVLEENRLMFAKEFADNTNYPATIQGGTVGLLIIEVGLNNIYGKDEYNKYFEKNHREEKIDAILKNEARRIIKDSVGSRPKQGVIVEQIVRVWLTMIANYKQYLGLEIIRKNKLARVMTRKVDDLEKTLVDEFKNY